jgi:ribose transport system ATP-binding protein
VVVLRDGKNAGELSKDQITHDAMVRLMVGRDMKQFYPRTIRTGVGGAAALTLREVRYRGGSQTAASFDVRAGEILGMAGLVGAGRTELSEAVFGVRPIVSGHLELDGSPIHIAHPSDAIAAGILLVPEDRRLHGLVLEESVGFNLSLPNLDILGSLTGVRRRSEAQLQAREIERLRIKTPSARQTAGLLSGGNQQKIVYGKWLAASMSARKLKSTRSSMNSPAGASPSG